MKWYTDEWKLNIRQSTVLTGRSILQYTENTVDKSDTLRMRNVWTVTDFRKLNKLTPTFKVKHSHCILPVINFA